jgi:thiamine biosynthesis lipoprotein
MTCTAAAAAAELTARQFRAIGTTVTVLVQDPGQADRAEAMLAAELDAIDRACSRFRADSELQMVHAHAGEKVRVSSLLFEAIEVACAVAEQTRGAVDPTVGNAIAALGYDRDLDEVLRHPTVNPVPPAALGPVAGYAHIHLDRSRRSVRIPRRVRLDLGSTAKALAADRAAARLADELGRGVLVSLGGDVAVAGPPPPGGWAVGIALDSSAPPDQVDQVVAIRSGGLASSSTAVRTWRAGDRQVHHIVNPRTGDCAEAYWKLVSAAGRSCVEANAVTTAAMVWGPEALDHLVPFAPAMRLVRHDGRIFTRQGWPAEEAP